eukprot:SAG11_NODE_25667_length_355_cov_3.894531_1_plen_86_part_01
MGFNEKRKLNIDTVCSEAAAPDHPKLKFLYPASEAGQPPTEILVDTIPKPARCELKEAHSDFRQHISELQASETAGLAEMHSKVGE